MCWSCIRGIVNVKRLGRRVVIWYWSIMGGECLFWIWICGRGWEVFGWVYLVGKIKWMFERGNFMFERFDCWIW